MQIVQLEPIGKDRTRVTLSGSGYAAGHDFDQLYAFFAQDNPEYLTSLKQHLEGR